MGHPVTAKQLVGVLRKRNIAVLGPLAMVDMDHHSFSVDIRDLQRETFRDPQPTSIDGRKAGVIVKGSDVAQEGEDFFLLKDTGKFSLVLGFEIGEDVPVALEYIHEEELHPTIGNANSGGGPLVHIPSMEEVVFEVGLADPVGSSLVEVHELTY